MKAIRIILASVMLILLANDLMAQPPGDPGGGGNPTPISGIEFLLGGGALLGVRQLISRFRSTKKE